MLPEKLWTVADVAEYLGVSERTVRTWQRTRRLPCLRIGGTVRFRAVDIVAWADCSCESARAVAGRTSPISRTTPQPVSTRGRGAGQ